MATKRITLYYALTKKKIIPPSPVEISRKDKWIHSLQARVESDWKPKRVKVTYEEYDPEIDNQRKFFEGPVVEYWLIQSGYDLEQRKDARTLLLDNTLGYNVPLLNGGTTRERRSTKDFTMVQEWQIFLDTLKETEFEPNGYEFPDSNYFKELKALHGYEKAKGILISKLKEKVEKLLQTNQ